MYPGMFSIKEITHQIVRMPYLLIMNDKFAIINLILCAIWKQLCNLRNMKNIHEGVLLLVKLHSLGNGICSGILTFKQNFS